MSPHQILQEAFFAKDIKEATKLLETFDFEDIVAIIQKTNARHVANLLSHLHPVTAREVLRAIPNHLVVKAIPHVPEAVVATLLRPLAQKERDEILQAISASQAKAIASLIEYPHNSAGRIMDVAALSLYQDLTVNEALAQIRNHPNKPPYHPVIISRNHELVGTLFLEDLIKAEGDTQLSAICFRDAPMIHHLKSEEHAVQLFQKNQHPILPVVDDEGRVLGVITDQALTKTWKEVLTAPLQTMVGVPKKGPKQISIWITIQKRLPWVTFNFLIASLAALILFFYKSTLTLNHVIVLLLPLLFIMPGSIGAQAHGVTVRGLGLGSFHSSRWYQFNLRELLIALVTGGLTSLVATTMAYIWGQTINLAIALGLALWLAIVLSGLAGAWLPLIMAKNNQERLQASSLTLCAITNLVGLSSYLALANLFLKVTH